MRQARERVRLVHELRQLRGAEELLQRGHDRADVDDRLRRDRVRVLGGEALADDALHAVEADPEGLLDQLADGAQAAVAEVLVLVEVVGDGLARAGQRLGRVVLDLLVELLGQAEQLRQRDELLDQGDDVVVGQGARLEVDVEVQARVELVAADAREVVALGVEEELVEQVARVVDARRLARALLLEQLDQRALLGLGDLGVGVDRVADVDRVVEEVEDLLVARVAHRAQQHRDRQLALAVDADEDLALLVDLELQPGAAGRHQVADEDLLLRVLGLHQVGARGTDELRHDDALGAVDDERAALGHPREVAHEDGLLADLAGLPVDEADRDGQRARVREVLLAALVERRDGRVELELPELDGQVARVVLDRRDVVDRLAQAPLLRVDEPGERLPLDVDQVGDIEHLVQAREVATGAGSIKGSQDGDSSGGDLRGTWARLPPRHRELSLRGDSSATSQDSTGRRVPLGGALGAHGPRPARTPYVAGRALWTAATIGRVQGIVAGWSNAGADALPDRRDRRDLPHPGDGGAADFACTFSLARTHAAPAQRPVRPTMSLALRNRCRTGMNDKACGQ